MRKMLILFALSLALFPQNLLKIEGNGEDETFSIILPQEMFMNGVEINIHDQTVDLGRLKEEGKIKVKSRNEDFTLTIKKLIYVKPQPGKKYSHFHLRVSGEEEISINLPMWFLRSLLWFIPYIKIETENPTKAKATKILLNFIMHPEDFTGGYVGPLHIIHVKDKEERVDIIVD